MAYIGRTPTGSILTGADIADGSISTAKIADTAVSTAKIADTAISTAKIADDAVGNTKLNLASVQPRIVDLNKYRNDKDKYWFLFSEIIL